eukprot:5845590-Amphidinium_carterae.1
MEQCEGGREHDQFLQNNGVARHQDAIWEARRNRNLPTESAAGIEDVVRPDEIRVELPVLQVLQVWISHYLFRMQGWSAGSRPKPPNQARTRRQVFSRITKPWEQLEHQLASEKDPEVKALLQKAAASKELPLPDHRLKLVVSIKNSPWRWTSSRNCKTPPRTRCKTCAGN